jgi:peptidoglycan/xylan/chitin deacetylase (PgdA/CDA1 family)
LRQRTATIVKRPEIATILYHEVTDDPASTGFQRASALPYKHRTAEFAAHLHLISRWGPPSGLVDTIDFSQGQRHLLLTFDDGGKSAMYVAEELARRGWKGHFFVTTGLIGHRCFLSAADIGEIACEGHLIGSHSDSHPDIFRDQSAAQMQTEWRTSRDKLEQILGRPCHCASVPGGDISRSVLRTAAASGFQYLFTSEPWLHARRVHDTWILGRVCPKVGTPMTDVEDWVRFKGWNRELARRRMKVLLRTALLPMYRRYVQKHRIEDGHRSQSHRRSLRS